MFRKKSMVSVILILAMLFQIAPGFATGYGDITAHNTPIQVDGETLDFAEPPLETDAQIDIAKLPIYFIPNQGQMDESVKYYSIGAGYDFSDRPERVSDTFTSQKSHLEEVIVSGAEQTLNTVSQEEQINTYEPSIEEITRVKKIVELLIDKNISDDIAMAILTGNFGSPGSGSDVDQIIDEIIEDINYKFNLVEISGLEFALKGAPLEMLTALKDFSFCFEVVHKIGNKDLDGALYVISKFTAGKIFPPAGFMIALTDVGLRILNNYTTQLSEQYYWNSVERYVSRRDEGFSHEVALHWISYPLYGTGLTGQARDDFINEINDFVEKYYDILVAMREFEEDFHKKTQNPDLDVRINFTGNDYGYAPFHVVASIQTKDPNREIASYQWTVTSDAHFTSTSPQLSYTFYDPGIHRVSVTITDIYGESDTAYAFIRVYNPVLAQFLPIPQGDLAGNEIRFDASSSTHLNQGNIQTYTWKFDDGTTKTSTSPISYHTYTSNSVYNVELTVSDNVGNVGYYKNVVFIGNNYGSSQIHGNVYQDLHLTQAFGPYIANTSVTVENGATLYIFPGTNVSFDHGLVVEGDVYIGAGAQINIRDVTIHSGGKVTVGSGAFISDDGVNWSVGGELFIESDCEMNYPRITVVGDGKLTLGSNIIINGLNLDIQDSGFVSVGVNTVLSDVTQINISYMASLLIEPGTVIKFRHLGALYVSGILDARSTEANPIYFTDRSDSDTPDGDSLGLDEDPQPGSWYGVEVQNGGSATLDYVVVRYGGRRTFWRGNGSNIYKKGSGTLTLTNSVLEHSSSFGLLLQYTDYTHVISGNHFANNPSRGISLHFAKGGTQITGNTIAANSHGIYISDSNPMVQGNRIHNNFIGIYTTLLANPIIGGSLEGGNNIYDNTHYAVQNTWSDITINAQYNWWGADSGPAHNSNPTGTGDSVSDYVDYSNFKNYSFEAAETAITEANTAIATLPDVNDITLNDKEAIESVRSLVEVVKKDYGVSDTDFDNLNKLLEAEAKIAELGVVISLSTNPLEGGTTNGGGIHSKDDSTTVTATPATGYEFVNWTEDGKVVSTDAEYTFTATSDRTLSANFATESCTISVSADPDGGGSVTGGGSNNYGDSVTVTATPATGYYFVNWTEDGEEVSTDSSYTFTAEGNRTLVANFELKEYVVSLESNPDSGGSVTGEGTYTHGEEVTVTSTPATGYTFINWTEEDQEVSNNSSYTFTIEEVRNFTANFKLKEYDILLIVATAEGGSVTGSGMYTHGEEVIITATPAVGHYFVGWTEDGEEISTESAYTFEADTTRELTAHFKLKEYSIDASVTPEASGTVTGQDIYEHGEEVTLAATPEAGYYFVNWTEAGEEVGTDTSYIFTAEKDRNLVANFKELLPGEEIKDVNPDNEGQAEVEFPKCQVSIRINTSKSGLITIVRYNEEDKSPPKSMNDVGIYLSIERSESLAGTKARIEASYDPESLPSGIDENSLRLWRYNETSQEWEKLPGGVDTERNVVWGETENFSVFGVFGESEILYGDVNGDGSIDVGDAILVLRHIVGLVDIEEEYGAEALVRAKVSGGEGPVDVGDAILILRYIVGLIDNF